MGAGLPSRVCGYRDGELEARPVTAEFIGIIDMPVRVVSTGDVSQQECRERRAADRDGTLRKTGHIMRSRGS